MILKKLIGYILLSFNRKCNNFSENLLAFMAQVYCAFSCFLRESLFELDMKF